MSRQAQAWAEVFERAWGSALRSAVPALLGAGLLSACAGGAMLKHADTDASLVTGSISAGPTEPDPEKDSDVATIRNALSSADLGRLRGAPIPWANSGTGSQGSIASIVEYRDKDRLCRRFTASRESFEGVMLYNGDACLHGGGFWWMRSFQPEEQAETGISS